MPALSFGESVVREPKTSTPQHARRKERKKIKIKRENNMPPTTFASAATEGVPGTLAFRIVRTSWCTPIGTRLLFKAYQTAKCPPLLHPRFANMFPLLFLFFMFFTNRFFFFDNDAPRPLRYTLYWYESLPRPQHSSETMSAKES